MEIIYHEIVNQLSEPVTYWSLIRIMMFYWLIQFLQTGYEVFKKIRKRYREI